MPQIELWPKFWGYGIDGPRARKRQENALNDVAQTAITGIVLNI